jgi:hypothetical protein
MLNMPKSYAVVTYGFANFTYVEIFAHHILIKIFQICQMIANTYVNKLYPPPRAGLK